MKRGDISVETIVTLILLLLAAVALFTLLYFFWDKLKEYINIFWGIFGG